MKKIHDSAFLSMQPVLIFVSVLPYLSTKYLWQMFALISSFFPRIFGRYELIIFSAAGNSKLLYVVFISA